MWKCQPGLWQPGITHSLGCILSCWEAVPGHPWLRQPLKAAPAELPCPASSTASHRTGSGFLPLEMDL